MRRGIIVDPIDVDEKRVNVDVVRISTPEAATTDALQSSLNVAIGNCLLLPTV